jgi:hypothetical protein
MPWVSKQTLIKTILKEHIKIHGNANTLTPFILEKQIEQYPSRIQINKDVVFGLYGDSTPEYEYYIL